MQVGLHVCLHGCLHVWCQAKGVCVQHCVKGSEHVVWSSDLSIGIYLLHCGGCLQHGMVLARQVWLLIRRVAPWLQGLRVVADWKTASVMAVEHVRMA